jgi:hypothetical protein
MDADAFDFRAELLGALDSQILLKDWPVLGCEKIDQFFHFNEAI